ncbi:MAG: hypothetical protein ACOX19_05710 [Fermentimonas sp.]
MKEKLFVGTIIDFAVEEEIRVAVRSLNQALNGMNSGALIVLRFASLQDIQDVFETGGEETLQKYEQSLQNELETLKKPNEIYRKKEHIPYQIQEFKTGLHIIKVAYDDVRRLFPKDAISVVAAEHGFMVKISDTEIKKANEAKTKVYAETAEEKELFKLCSQVCELCDKIISLQNKPSASLPDPLGLFAYKNTETGREAVINPGVFKNYLI